MKNWIAQIPKHEKKVFSQGMQDGAIEYICDNIEIKNKFCVEFGYDSNTLSTGCGPNTTNLIKNRDWSQLLLDGNK